MLRPVTVLLALLASLGASPAAAATWTPLPSGFDRYYHRAIYDSLRTRMIVFGGVDSLYRNDVHELTLGGAPAWNLIAPSGTPPDVRNTHSLIYDPLRDRMLLFAGAKMFGLTVVLFNDVWALSLGPSPAWTQLAPAGTKPAARHGHTLIYDPVRDRLIVFGGRDVVGFRNDVWELSLSGTPTWTQLTPSGTPPTARGDATAIYDPLRDRMILFGGFDGKPNYVGDVWELTFSPLAWNPISAGAGPTARERHVAIYDPGGDRMVVFGGQDAVNHWTNDVWGLSLAGTPLWSNLTPAGGSAPPARWGHSGVYDSVNQDLVIFGGSAATGFFYDDAWALSLGPPVAVGDAGSASHLSVMSAGPNPACQEWSLAFRTGETGIVTLRLYDTAGRIVRHLWNGPLASGAHALPWDLRSDAGVRVPAGTYFYELREGNRRLGKALVVIGR